MGVKKLPAGAVVFEDISENRHRGHVIKAITSKSMNSSMDGQLTGMIEYQGKTDTHEVLFGDRDTEDSIILQKGMRMILFVYVLHFYRPIQGLFNDRSYSNYWLERIQ